MITIASLILDQDVWLKRVFTIPESSLFTCCNLFSLRICSDLQNTDLMDIESVNKSNETVMLMPEYLIVCCWRSVKEISLVLGQLTASSPIGEAGLLSFQQVSNERMKMSSTVTIRLPSGYTRDIIENIYMWYSLNPYL